MMKSMISQPNMRKVEGWSALSFHSRLLSCIIFYFLLAFFCRKLAQGLPRPFEGRDDLRKALIATSSEFKEIISPSIHQQLGFQIRKDGMKLASMLKAGLTKKKGKAFDSSKRETGSANLVTVAVPRNSAPPAATTRDVGKESRPVGGDPSKKEQEKKKRKEGANYSDPPTHKKPRGLSRTGCGRTLTSRPTGL